MMTFKFKKTESLRGMNRTEIALYWATASWVMPTDVPSETGLPEDDARPIGHEIERVRKLFQEAHEPLFRSYNGLLRPLSRELAWVDRWRPEADKAAFEQFTAWTKRAKVGEKRSVTIWLGDKPDTETTFVCERVE